MSPRAFRWGSLALVVLALGLGCFRLDRNDVWFDESVSYFFSRIPGLDFFKALLGQDTHGPLYYGLLKLWTLLWGEGPWAGRLPSVMFAAGTVWVVVHLGARVFGRAAGLAAGLLLALCPFHLFYAQEIRFYSFIELLVAIQVTCFLGLLAPPQNLGGAPPSSRRYFWGFVLSAAACLWTYYFSGLVLLAEAAVALMLWPRIRRKRVVLAFVAVALCRAPWAPFMLWQARHTTGSIGWISDSGTWAFLGQAYRRFVAGNETGWLGLASAPVLLTAVAAALIGALRSRHPGRLLLAVWFILPFSAVLIISVWKPLYQPRYLLMLAPAFFLLAVGGLFRLRILWLRMVLFAVVVMGLSFADVHYYTHLKNTQRWNDAVAFLKTHAERTDTLVAAPVVEVATLAYYFPRYPSRWGAEAAAHVTPHLQAGRRVWLVSSPQYAELRKEVASQYRERESHDFGTLNVKLFLPAARP
jgi:4-amino-4-deoxy-L-arabinose transferase-like glycosyltransferase